MSLQPGEVFAGYTIVRELGSGGMGQVYLAVHPRLPRQVALKLLRPGLGSDPAFAGRFQREAATVAALDHPNIVPVDDRGNEGDQLWLTMPYIDGENAETALAAYRPGGMPAARAVHIVSRVASALEFAHRHQLIHRDVKPANIMLAASDDPNEPERVYLTDFGVAKGIGEYEGTSYTTAGSVIATLDYAAPEQIEGKPLDGRTDIYALGCVLFKLLTGAIPFPGDTMAAKIYAHLHHPPPRPSEWVPGLPPAFDQVVAVALAARPEDRFQSPRALADAARSALRAVGPGPVNQPSTQSLGGRTVTQDIRDSATLRSPLTFGPQGGFISGTPPGGFVPPPGHPPIGPSQPPVTPALAPFLQPAGQGPPPNPSRRRQWLLIGLVVAVIAAAATTVVLLSGKLGGSAGQGAGTTPATTTAVTTTKNTATSTRTSPTPTTASSSTTSTTSSPATSTSAAPFVPPLSQEQRAAMVAAKLPQAADPLPETTLLVTRMVSGGQTAVFPIDTDSGAVGEAITESGAPRNPTLNTDRRTFLYAQNNGIWAAPTAKGDDPVELFHGADQGCADVQRPGWDPVDDTVIVVPCNDGDGRTSLVVARIDGTVIRKLTDGLPGHMDDVTFAPDGTAVAFWGNDDPKATSGALFSVKLDGSDLAKLTTVSSGDVDPVWSPDGTKIAFARGKGLAILALDDNNVVRTLDEVQPVSAGPCWSPGGDQLAYRSTAGGKTEEVWVVNADGSGPRMLGGDDHPGLQGSPVWGLR